MPNEARPLGRCQGEQHLALGNCVYSGRAMNAMTRTAEQSIGHNRTVMICIKRVAAKNMLPAVECSSDQCPRANHASSKTSPSFSKEPGCRKRFSFIPIRHPSLACIASVWNLTHPFIAGLVPEAFCAIHYKACGGSVRRRLYLENAALVSYSW